MTSSELPTAEPNAMPIIHLNGFPGTGKLTIARKLVESLNTHPTKHRSTKVSDNVSAKLVHNHLLIDPANAILSRTQPGYQQLRKAIREVVFTSLIEERSTDETVYVFTDYQSGDDVGSRVCEEFKTMAEARGCQLIPILILCDEQENIRRLKDTERATWSKVTDSELLLQFRQQMDPPAVYEFPDNKARLTVDVTNLSAEKAAKVVLRHVSKYVPGILAVA